MGSNISARAETRAIMDGVRHIVQALRESGRGAERHAGISGAQLFVLHTLADAQPLTLNALAARTHTHQSSVSVVVSRLVERGLVHRVQSASDGRQRELSLSAKGQRVAGRAPDAAQARLVLAIETLPSSRRRLLAAALGELAQAMDAVDRVPPMFFEERRHPQRRREAGRARR
jgi:DNA-binding MarR family transcriptional regulator